MLDEYPKRDVSPSTSTTSTGARVPPVMVDPSLPRNVGAPVTVAGWLAEDPGPLPTEKYKNVAVVGYGPLSIGNPPGIGPAPVL